jgi:putative cell wall-binding protein
MSAQTAKRKLDEFEGNVDGEEVEVWVPYKQRKEMEHKKRETKLKPIKKSRNESDEEDLTPTKSQPEIQRPSKSLFDQKVEMMKNPELAQKFLTPGDNLEKEEEMILENLSDIRKPLLSVSEIAKDIKYDKPMPSNWRPPKYIQNLTVSFKYDK